MNRAILAGSVILAITVLATVSIVPYATAGDDPIIGFEHFDRNDISLEVDFCNTSITSITYQIRGKTTVELVDGSNSGNEFRAPGGTNEIRVNYGTDIIKIANVQFIKHGTPVGGIDNFALGGATSVDIKASKIVRAQNSCGGDVPKGTTSVNVFAAS